MAAMELYDTHRGELGRGSQGRLGPRLALRGTTQGLQRSEQGARRVLDE